MSSDKLAPATPAFCQQRVQVVLWGAQATGKPEDMKTAEEVRALLQGSLSEPFVVAGPEAGVYWPEIQCDCVMDERDELPIAIVHVFRSLDDIVALDPLAPDEHEDAVGWFYDDSPPGHWMAISTYEPNVQLVYATEQRALDDRWHALDRALSA